MRSASSNIRSIDLSHVISGGLRMERSESSTMTLTSLSKFVGAGVPPELWQQRLFRDCFKQLGRHSM
jgi:hypothetical protein